MAINRDYLNLITPQEASSRGINLNDKIRHAIYTAVQTRSTEKNAGSGQLFRYPNKYDELAGLPDSDFISAMKYLLADRLVAQLCALEYLFESDKLEMQLFFIAKPPAPVETTGGLYREVIRYTAQEVEKWGFKRPDITSDNLYQLLKADFESEDLTEVSEGILYDIFADVKEESFLYTPAIGQLDTFKHDVLEDLSDYPDFILLENYGCCIVKDNNVLTVFNTAENFMQQRLMPIARNDPSCSRVFEQVYLEEEEHKADKNALPRTDFSLKRSKAIQKALQRKGIKQGNGMLTLLLVQKLANRAASLLQKEYKDSMDQKLKELLQDVLSEEADIEKRFLSIPQEQQEEMPDRLWAALKEHPDIVLSEWELPTGKIYTILKKDAEVFAKWIRHLEKIPRPEIWQILATKKMLEAVEQEMPHLFQDKEFVKTYGHILRKAYLRYIPWYLWLFVFLGMQPFLDKAFQIAKGKIDSQQKKLAEKNKIKWQKKTAEIQEHRIAKATLLKEIQEKNKFKDILDEFYFVHGTIPTVNLVASKLSESDSKNLVERLKKLHFILLGGSEKKEGSMIVMYPRDREWSRLRGKLFSAVEQILDRTSKKQDAEAKALASNAQVILKYLNAKSTSSLTPTRDPFEELEKLIRKEKDKNELNTK
ncbi:MAG: hypothetical protein D6767_05200 [Candidatus Hydrogenedentota bacterium]|nr:MAG: hypothetical protein D6767_05200 [Candidatus Hydrogenedentota bacterium]